MLFMAFDADYKAGAEDASSGEHVAETLALQYTLDDLDGNPSTHFAARATAPHAENPPVPKARAYLRGHSFGRGAALVSAVPSIIFRVGFWGCAKSRLRS
jgi:hypothetical protein